MGSQLHRSPKNDSFAIVIDIQLHGLPLFYFARQGTTPDNPEWVRRKRNIVRRFCESYATGLMVKSEKLNLEALNSRDYAHHGGSFPIFLKGTGCVGTITVSGLPQREDHSLVVEIRRQVPYSRIFPTSPSLTRCNVTHRACRYPYRPVSGKFHQT